jgi:hypothetical protein
MGVSWFTFDGHFSDREEMLGAKSRFDEDGALPTRRPRPGA